MCKKETCDEHKFIGRKSILALPDSNVCCWLIIHIKIVLDMFILKGYLFQNLKYNCAILSISSLLMVQSEKSAF